MSISFEEYLTAEWLTVRQVADILDVSDQAVYRWVREQRLPALRLGSPRGSCRIRRSDLDTFIRTSYGRTRQSPAFTALNRTVLAALVEAGDWVSRADIAEMTGLDPKRITYAITRMTREGQPPFDVQGTTRDRLYRANADTIAYLGEIAEKEAA